MDDIFNNELSVGDLVAYPIVVRRHYEMRTGVITKLYSKAMLGYAEIKGDKTRVIVTRRTSEIAKAVKC